MTSEQLDSIISHYKEKAVRAYNYDDTFTCNRMIAIVHDLEDNYDDYLSFEYGNDYLELYFDSIIPKVEPRRHPLFHDIDPYDEAGMYEVLEWMEETEEDFDEEFDEDFDMF